MFAVHFHAHSRLDFYLLLPPPLPLPYARHISLPLLYSRRQWSSSGGCLHCPYTLRVLPFSPSSFLLVLPPPPPPPVSGVCRACLLLLGHWQHTGLEAGWADVHLQLERHHVRRLRHLSRHQDVSFMIPSLTGPRHPLIQRVEQHVNFISIQEANL